MAGGGEVTVFGWEGIIAIILLVLLIVVLWWAFAAGRRPRHPGPGEEETPEPPPPPVGESPEDHLRRCYANGEITKEEYDRRMERLRRRS